MSLMDQPKCEIKEVKLSAYVRGDSQKTNIDIFWDYRDKSIQLSKHFAQKGKGQCQICESEQRKTKAFVG